MSRRFLQYGEPAHWFVCPSPTNPAFDFSTAAGRFVVLCFFGTAGDVEGRQVLEDVRANRDVFDDENVSFFGVSIDPRDESTGRVRTLIPGIRFFWDFDGHVSRLFGALGDDNGDVHLTNFRRFSIVLDERLRLVKTLPFENNVRHVPQVIDALHGLPAVVSERSHAPVLIVPRVFPPNLCRELIAYYESDGGNESGFVTEENGRTVSKFDYHHKRRRDKQILDESLRTSAMRRIHDCVAPEIYKAFQFQATRIERYIVSCYDSATGGHFRPHRDNTTKGTAHRKFAVSLNLNSEFEGGNLRFPEFGRQTYKAPMGGAIIFSCSLLHEATPITKGKRYAFLPFLYDETGAQLRQHNLQYLSATL